MRPPSGAPAARYRSTGASRGTDPAASASVAVLSRSGHHPASGGSWNGSVTSRSVSAGQPNRNARAQPASQAAAPSSGSAASFAAIASRRSGHRPGSRLRAVRAASSSMDSRVPVSSSRASRSRAWPRSRATACCAAGIAAASWPPRASSPTWDADLASSPAASSTGESTRSMASTSLTPSHSPRCPGLAGGRPARRRPPAGWSAVPRRSPTAVSAGAPHRPCAWSG